ncbi:MAG: F0F1 ATP synthase subunit delta [candidate division Zixibacteria bacterium]|nr:F0F1 ATP synthase subunit delta [candidate division Zixibacteria bacterium]
MIDQMVGKRYALALFNTAESSDLTDQVQENLVLLSGLWGKNEELRAFLEAPQIAKVEKTKILEQILRDKISELLLQFLLFLIEKDRFQQISEIAEHYNKLLKEKLGIVEARVTTASPIDEKLTLPLKEKLQKKTGKNVNLVFQTDPSLIGGIRVIIGNQIIDNSISSELCKLREDLLSLKV